MRTPIDFDVLVVTAPNDRSARAYEEELRARVPRRFCRRRDGGEVLLLAVADPAGTRVGSGGGTLNALEHARAALQAEQGLDLKDAAVLMIHSGGDSQRSPTNSVCGKAWSLLNSTAKEEEEDHEDGGCALNTPLDLMLEQLLPLFQGVPKGSLVVASSDVMLILPPTSAVAWAKERGVVGLATLVAAELGPNHGVYVTPTAAASASSSTQPVSKYLQKASLPELQAQGAVDAAGTVQVDTGVVYFSPAATSMLAALLDEEPFLRCTTRGLQGNDPTGALRLELYSDMLCALSGGMGQSHEAYMRMDGASAPLLVAARERLWALLNPLSFSALVPPGSLFAHLGTTAELMEMMALKMGPFTHAFHLARRACAHVDAPSVTDEGAVLLNALIVSETASVHLGKDAVVEHSFFAHAPRTPCLEVGPGALVSGLCFAAASASAAASGSSASIRVWPGICVQEVRLSDPGKEAPGTPAAADSGSSLPLPPQPYVVTMLAVDDPIKASFDAASAGSNEEARVWGLPWATVLAALGVDSPDAIWPPEGPRTLWTARLFPLLHPGTSPPVLADWWRWAQESLLSGRRPSPEQSRAWREARRLSLSEILALAEPGVEFRWRRRLEGLVRQATQRRRAASLAALQQELMKQQQEQGGAGGRGRFRFLDGLWRPLPLDDRRWLVGELEAWAEARLLSQGASSTLAATSALLARVLRETGASTAADATALFDAAAVAAAGQVAGGGATAADGEVDAYDDRWTCLLDRLLALLAEDAQEEDAAAAAEERRQLFRELRRLRVAWTEAAPVTRCGWLAAAAHAELGALRLVQQQVATVRAAVTWEPAPPLAPGSSAVAEAPARIDLSGGWSDTPPISFELGGEVTNLAVRLHGRRPIGARATVLPPSDPRSKGVVVMRARQADGTVTETACRRVADFAEAPSPGCPTAIVKCVLRYCGVVRVDNNTKAEGLERQLRAALGAGGASGLCIETWSELPTGSGLGTSSILVGTVIAAVGRACGRVYPLASLNHAVLEVEQMLGVGGGWQDQVGGLVGGLKRGFSPRGLPLRVGYECSPLPAAARRALEARVVLVYTGRQRLARHMVRSVLRRYYARCPRVLETVAALVAGAREAQAAVLDGDMEALGRCLSRYWEAKKTMAGPSEGEETADDDGHHHKSFSSSSSSSLSSQPPRQMAEAAGRQDIVTTDAPAPPLLSCEPAHVRQLMKALRPHALGMSLAGAGGGGFLVCVLRGALLRLGEEGQMMEVDADIARNNADGGGGGTGTITLQALQALVEQQVPGAYVSPIEVDEVGLSLEVVSS